MQAQDVARRISGAVAGESAQKSIYQVPITIPVSRITLFAICLLFSSPPNSPLLFYSPSLSLSSLSFPFASFARLLLFARVLDCLFVAMAQPRFGDLHLKRLEEIETNVRKFMVLQFEHNNFFRNELKEQKSFMSYMNKELDDMSKEFYGIRAQIASLEKNDR